MSRAYINKAKTVEWTTPKEVFEELNQEFNFNLDVASTHENALCQNHFTEAENGLKRVWGGITCFVIHLTTTLRHGARKHMKNETTQTLLCY